ncbi:MAG: hypothetical protein WA862_01205 [Solirubrobacterales bacterium]
MRRGIALRSALALLAASLLFSDGAVANQASQLLPVQLRVLDGDGIADGDNSWHPDNYFVLAWARPPIAEQGFPVTAANYRLYSAAGIALGERDVHVPGDVTWINNVRLPSPFSPGTYRAEVWLEGPDGQRGPGVSTALRFDDTRPGLAQPLPPAGWVAGTAAAMVTIEHPAGPQPVSGIRGYAVSVDRGAGSLPCAGSDRCSLAETDLRGGIADDRVSLGVLPEGINFVRTVAVSGSGKHSLEAESAIVRVDATLPAVTLRGAPPSWANGPVRVTASATDALSGMAASGPSGPFTAIAVDGAVPRVEPGASAVAVISGEGVHPVAFYARDAAGNLDQRSPPTTAVRIDESPPRVAFVASQDPAEPERMEAIVTDPLSGPGPARGSIAVRPAHSRQPFARLPTTVSGSRLIARWDSDAFPLGTYEFSATGYDAAGNATVSERRVNGARVVLVNPLKKPTAIVAGFGGRRLVWQRCSRSKGRRSCRREEIEAFERRPRTRTTPYGHSLSYAGQLTSASGSSLGGQPVQIVETFSAGADSKQRATTTETAADGTFSTRLAPGPSRRIEALFAGNRTLTRVGGGKVRLRVLGDTRMHASSSTARIGGAPIVFSGGIGDLGAPIPAGGMPVELQFRFPGSDWSGFRTVQTDAHGHFRYRYEFSDDDSRGVRFQFRAFAPEQDDWPYEPAFSRPVFVTGR